MNFNHLLLLSRRLESLSNLALFTAKQYAMKDPAFKAKMGKSIPKNLKQKNYKYMDLTASKDIECEEKKSYRINYK
jgi:hypothetical protein